MSNIRIGIVGYGNLGRGVEHAIQQNPDMELVAVFTRRDPGSVTLQTAGVPVVSLEDAPSFSDKIDVCILCGGSATDLPEQGPSLARLFHTVDSFDTHAKIPAYFQAMDQALRDSDHLGAISLGWDPGLFSVNRVMFDAFLPSGNAYTFWGRGVSQGHSDAIRRVPGVKRGIQYTVPKAEALASVRNGENPTLAGHDAHLRECYVVLEAGADAAQVENSIRTMPHYFAEYDSVVHFISEEEFNQNHNTMPHGGSVFHAGSTGGQHKHLLEFSIQLDSNPEFTSSVLVAYARAVYRLAAEGRRGALTVLDIPPALLSLKSSEELRASML